MNGDGPRLEIDLEEDIREGMEIGHIYRQTCSCVERWVSAMNMDRPKRGMAEGYGKENDEAGIGDEISTRQSDSDGCGVEENVSVWINGSEKVIRVNTVFEGTVEFASRLSRFLRDLSDVSHKLRVELGNIDKELFLGFVLDSFNLFGDVRTLVNSFRPVGPSTIQKSGLVCEEIFRVIFLLQYPRGGMKTFLAFNVFAISICHDNKYIGELLNSLSVGTISKMVNSMDGDHRGHPGIHFLDGGDTHADGSSTMTFVFNGLYLLFDIFDLDDQSLRDILYILLVFLTRRRNREVTRFLGLSGIFICTTVFVCRDRISSHVLMATCRDKLNMGYKVDTLGISMDYIYNWIYKPRLASELPRYFSSTGIRRPDTMTSEKLMRMMSGKIVVRPARDEGRGSRSIRGPAYSPLSRRLSGGLKGKDIYEFKSKQKLVFDD